MKQGTALGYKRLKVYAKAQDYSVLSDKLLAGVQKSVAANDHLARATESVLNNIVQASASRSKRERTVFLGTANGSALECSACLDVLVVKELLGAVDAFSAKGLLKEIVSMLIGWKKAVDGRVNEDSSEYQVGTETIFFSHERLDVYRAALRLTAWVELAGRPLVPDGRFFAKLDKTTTSIVLNIAEGNGRFTEPDQARFLAASRRAAIGSVSLLERAATRFDLRDSLIDPALTLLSRIVAMLNSLESTLLPQTKNT